MKALIDKIEGPLWKDLCQFGWATRVWGILANRIGFNRKENVALRCSTSST